MLATMTSHRLPACRGLSVVELLVGLSIGLVVIAVGLLAWAHQLRETRHLLLENRLMQDLRATSDLMTRELRRAGHWAEAGAGVWQDDRTAVSINPHAQVKVSGQSVTFGYSLPATRSTQQDELLEYRLHEGVIEMKLGRGSWQAVTDAGTLFITEMSIAEQHWSEPLQDFCALDCAS